MKEGEREREREREREKLYPADFSFPSIIRIILHVISRKDVILLHFVSVCTFCKNHSTDNVQRPKSENFVKMKEDTNFRWEETTAESDQESYNILRWAKGKPVLIKAIKIIIALLFRFLNCAVINFISTARFFERSPRVRIS